jgi:hypothetical protein
MEVRNPWIVPAESYRYQIYRRRRTVPSPEADNVFVTVSNLDTSILKAPGL